MGKILKNYLFWTYQRGSFHYDVMVTLILLFIFVTPFFIDYGDRPQSALLPREGVLVRQESAGQFSYDLGSAEVENSGTRQELQQSLLDRIEPIAGPVVIDSFTARTDSGGHVVGYRVWAHRATGK